MRERYNNKISLYFILILGAGLRLYKLGATSLWSDEAAFVLVRSGGFFNSLKCMWASLFNRYWFEIKNYAYNLFTTFWSCLYRNEFMLRLSSVIFGVICIVFIYKTGKLFFDKKTGLISAFLIALSPFHIYYSQEFRMYTLISLLALVSVYFLGRFQKKGESSSLFWYAAAHLLNIYIHMATILIFFAEVVFFIFYRKRYQAVFRKWLIANLIVIFLVMPEVILIIRDSIHCRDITKILSISLSPFGEYGYMELLPLYTFKNFYIGYNAELSIWVPAVLLFSALFIWSMVKIKNKESLYLCLCCLFIPIFVMYAGQRFLYADRYLIPSSVFLYLIISNGITYLRKTLIIAILVLISILVIFSLNNYYKNYLPCPVEQRFAVHEKKANREAVAHILSNFHEGDVVFHTHNHTTLPFEYYFNYYFKTKNDMGLAFNKEQIAMVLEFSKNNRDLIASEMFKAWGDVGKILTQTSLPVEGYKRVWLVFSAREFNEACNTNSSEWRKLEWMRRHYIEGDVKYFKGINLYLFRGHEEANE